MRQLTWSPSTVWLDGHAMLRESRLYKAQVYRIKVDVVQPHK